MFFRIDLLHFFYLCLPSDVPVGIEWIVILDVQEWLTTPTVDKICVGCALVNLTSIAEIAVLSISHNTQGQYLESRTTGIGDVEPDAIVGSKLELAHKRTTLCRRRISSDLSVDDLLTVQSGICGAVKVECLTVLQRRSASR